MNSIFSFDRKCSIQMVVTLHVTSAAIGNDLSLVEVFYLYRLLPVYCACHKVS